MAEQNKIKKQKGKYAEGFNTQLINLFKELTHMYPDNKDFKLIKNQVQILSQTLTYEIPIKTYEINIATCRDHLKNRNEQFFLQFNLENTPLQQLNYLKDIWKSIGEETKNAMWRYFFILDKLSEKYHTL